MKLPPLYFRHRENGAAVFRVDAENRRGRLDLEPLAFANVRSGEIRVQGDRTLSEGERAEIEAWIEQQQAETAEREAAAADRAIEALGAAAHWAQTRASDAEIEARSAELLLAIHDLRSVLVRRQSDAVAAARDED